jgi:hypothetical protein
MLAGVSSSEVIQAAPVRTVLASCLVRFASAYRCRQVPHPSAHFSRLFCCLGLTSLTSVCCLPACRALHPTITPPRAAPHRAGVASTNAWLSLLSWEYSRDFAREPGEVWSVDGLPAGWQRSASTLTQVVVRNAGHMVSVMRATGGLRETSISALHRAMDEDMKGLPVVAYA